MLSTFGLNSILLVAALFLGYPSRSKKANLNIAKFFGILNIVVIIDHAVKVAVSFVRDLSHPGFLPGKSKARGGGSGVCANTTSNGARHCTVPLVQNYNKCGPLCS
jgi:hypothetical protein